VVYAALPYFRDPEVRVPDEYYDVSRQLKPAHHLERLDVDGATVRLAGHAYVEGLDTVQDRVELVLRERDSGIEHRLMTTPAVAEEPGGTRPAGVAGFTVEIDLATVAGGRSLPRGLWDVHLVVHTHGLQQELRFGHRRSAGVDAGVRTYLAALGGPKPSVVTTYFTHPYSNLTIEVGEVKHRLDSRLGTPRADWAEDGAALVVSGRLDVAEAAEGTLAVRLQERAGATREIAAVVVDGGYRVDVPIASLPVGHWSVGVVLDLSTVRRDLAVPQPDGLTAVHWAPPPAAVLRQTRGLEGAVELRVAPVDLVAGVQRRLERVTAHR
jgi:poly(ribitol-phosphate) beta-N-acetylglucosaminyltransferase